MITLERLKQKLVDGQISRRSFMEGALAVGATVAIGVVFVAVAVFLASNPIF